MCYRRSVHRDCTASSHQESITINSLPNDKILDRSKLKAFAEDKLNVVQKLNFFNGRVKSIVGKRRECWLPAFSPFPTMISKVLHIRVVKSRDCVVKG